MSQDETKQLRNRVAALEQRIRELESEAEEAEETRQALALSEQRFRLAFETSPDAISLTRAADGKMVDVNAGFTDVNLVLKWIALLVLLSIIPPLSAAAAARTVVGSRKIFHGIKKAEPQGIPGDTKMVSCQLKGKN